MSETTSSSADGPRDRRLPSWDRARTPGRLFPHLGEAATDRKLRLLLCAAVRESCGECGATHLLSSVEVAERFADGDATAAELRGAEYDVGDLLFDPRYRGAGPQPANAAFLAAATFDGRLVLGAGPFRLYGIDTCGLLPASERHRLGRYIKDAFANPFRPVAFDPAWRTSVVVALAEGIYADRAFERLPILADALMEAGCDHPDVLAHCSGTGSHARGCWVVDAALGKA